MSHPWELDNPETQLLYEIRGLKRAIERGATWKGQSARRRTKRIGALAEVTGQGDQTAIIMRALKMQAQKNEARSVQSQEGHAETDA